MKGLGSETLVAPSGTPPSLLSEDSKRDARPCFGPKKLMGRLCQRIPIETAQTGERLKSLGGLQHMLGALRFNPVYPQ